MDQLPEEMVLRILKYLSTYELIQFCQATGKYYFLREKNLVRVVNLARQFETHTMPLCKFLLKNVHFNSIETLNVSHLYWIKSTELKRIISRMGSLNELIAVYTNLELHELKRPVYMKLKKLAVSRNGDEVIRGPCMQNNLKSLYLQINEVPLQVALMGDFSNLEELWIVNNEVEGECPDYYATVQNFKNLKKLVIKDHTLISDFNLDHLGLHKIFDRKSVVSSIMMFEKLEKPNVTQSTESREYGICKIWDKINESLNYLPCGFKECRQLFFNPDIDQIFFQELNFTDDHYQSRPDDLEECNHSPCNPTACHIRCKSEEYYKAILKLLCSINVSQLKKLAIKSCHSFYTSIEVNGEPSQKSKHNRSLIYKKIGDNIKHLKVLEILPCGRCHQNSDFLTHYMVDIFGTLEKVMLIMEKESCGYFLKKVIQKCPNLYSLNIICDDRNRSPICWCLYLKFATSLQDFRFDYKVDDISIILEALCKISTKKLLRVVLKCKTVLGCYNELFKVFLEENPQIILLYLIVTDDFDNDARVLQNTFTRLRNGNPSKVYLVKPNDTHYYLSVPAAHRDMLLNVSNVSIINLEDF